MIHIIWACLGGSTVYVVDYGDRRDAPSASCVLGVPLATRPSSRSRLSSRCGSPRQAPCAAVSVCSRVCCSIFATFSDFFGSWLHQAFSPARHRLPWLAQRGSVATSSSGSISCRAPSPCCSTAPSRASCVSMSRSPHPRCGCCSSRTSSSNITLLRNSRLANVWGASSG